MRFSRKSSAAFSLVEVSLALGVAAFALIAVFGLLPVGLNSNRAAIRETEVAGVLTNIVSDLRSTATSGSTAGISPRLKINLTSSASTTYYMDGGGGPYPAVGMLAGNSQYRVTVTVVLPPAPSPRTATQVMIVASWPAAAPLANAAGMVSSYVALDRN